MKNYTLIGLIAVVYLGSYLLWLSERGSSSYLAHEYYPDAINRAVLDVAFDTITGLRFVEQGQAPCDTDRLLTDHREELYGACQTVWPASARLYCRHWWTGWWAAQRCIALRTAPDLFDNPIIRERIERGIMYPCKFSHLLNGWTDYGCGKNGLPFSTVVLVVGSDGSADPSTQSARIYSYAPSSGY
ncbi:MAG: hypothetical protein AB7V53_06935 [Dongiaceae bacterium]